MKETCHSSVKTYRIYNANSGFDLIIIHQYWVFSFNKGNLLMWDDDNGEIGEGMKWNMETVCFVQVFSVNPKPLWKEERKEGREKRKDQWLTRVLGRMGKAQDFWERKTILCDAPQAQLWMVVVCWPVLLVFLNFSDTMNVPCKFWCWWSCWSYTPFFCLAIYRWSVTLT